MDFEAIVRRDAVPGLPDPDDVRRFQEELVAEMKTIGESCVDARGTFEFVIATVEKLPETEAVIEIQPPEAIDVLEFGESCELEISKFEDFLPGELKTLLREDGALNGSLSVTKESIEALSGKVAGVNEAMANALRSDTVRELAKNIGELEKIVESTLDALGNNIEEVLTEGLSGVFDEQCEEAISILDEVDALVDSGVEDLVGEIDGVIGELDGLVSTLNEVKPVWEMYEALS